MAVRAKRLASGVFSLFAMFGVGRFYGTAPAQTDTDTTDQSPTGDLFIGADLRDEFDSAPLFDDTSPDTNSAPAGDCKAADGLSRTTPGTSCDPSADDNAITSSAPSGGLSFSVAGVTPPPGRSPLAKGTEKVGDKAPGEKTGDKSTTEKVGDKNPNEKNPGEKNPNEKNPNEKPPNDKPPSEKDPTEGKDPSEKTKEVETSDINIKDHIVPVRW